MQPAADMLHSSVAIVAIINTIEGKLWNLLVVQQIHHTDGSVFHLQGQSKFFQIAQDTPCMQHVALSREGVCHALSGKVVKSGRVLELHLTTPALKQGDATREAACSCGLLLCAVSCAPEKAGAQQGTQYCHHCS